MITSEKISFIAFTYLIIINLITYYILIIFSTEIHKLINF